MLALRSKGLSPVHSANCRHTTVVVLAIKYGKVMKAWCGTHKKIAKKSSFWQSMSPRGEKSIYQQCRRDWFTLHHSRDDEEEHWVVLLNYSHTNDGGEREIERSSLTFLIKSRRFNDLFSVNDSFIEFPFSDVSPSVSIYNVTFFSLSFCCSFRAQCTFSILILLITDKMYIIKALFLSNVYVCEVRIVWPCQANKKAASIISNSLANMLQG